MGLKLNGATSGSIEIDVPAVAGTDTAITIPATSGGEFIVSDSAGDVNIDSGTLFVDASTNNVGIGTTSPQTALNTFSSNARGLTIAQDQPAIAFEDTTGTTYAYFGVQNNDTYISNVANGTTRFSTNDTERFRINSNGGISCFGTAAAHGFRVTQTAGTDAIIFAQNNSSSVTTGSNVFIVRADGDVENATGNYTAFSDQRFKENILDAGSQWADIKSIQIKKFNFKESTGLATHTQIGVIAQELEQVCPNLVKTVLPVDNTDDEDEAYKTVKLSVLYMKAVKALQEAMERIETLEAKVAQLEGGAA